MARRDDDMKSLLIAEGEGELVLEGLDELQASNEIFVERWRMRSLGKGPSTSFAEEKLAQYKERGKRIEGFAADVASQLALKDDRPPTPIAEDKQAHDTWSEFAWEDDCQGKKDFDGKVVSFGCRFYPRGGSADVWDDKGNHTNRHSPERQHIKPSALCDMQVLGAQIARAEFEADTEEEVHALAEAWAEEQTARVRSAVLRAFNRGT